MAITRAINTGAAICRSNGFNIPQSRYVIETQIKSRLHQKLKHGIWSEKKLKDWSSAVHDILRRKSRCQVVLKKACLPVLFDIMMTEAIYYGDKISMFVRIIECEGKAGRLARRIWETSPTTRNLKSWMKKNKIHWSYGEKKGINWKNVLNITIPNNWTMERKTKKAAVQSNTLTPVYTDASLEDEKGGWASVLASDWLKQNNSV